MISEDFNKIIDYIVKECIKLKDKYIQEKNLKVDYVCIFSHSVEEYNGLLRYAEKVGKVVDETPTGPVFAFTIPPETIAGRPKLLKIRKSDETRPQRGDVDFNTSYEGFKKKYLDDKQFTLIKREGFEMIELKDSVFDVLVYFSNIPLSKQLGVS